MVDSRNERNASRSLLKHSMYYRVGTDEKLDNFLKTIKFDQEAKLYLIEMAYKNSKLILKIYPQFIGSEKNDFFFKATTRVAFVRYVGTKYFMDYYKTYISTSSNEEASGVVNLLKNRNIKEGCFN